MREQYYSLYDMSVEKARSMSGYVAFSYERDADPGTTIKQFDTKEEFEEHFVIINKNRGIHYIKPIDEDDCDWYLIIN